jgi:hypothetical protein
MLADFIEAPAVVRPEKGGLAIHTSPATNPSKTYSAVVDLRVLIESSTSGGIILGTNHHRFIEDLSEWR